MYAEIKYVKYVLYVGIVDRNKIFVWVNYINKYILIEKDDDGI